MDPSSMTEHLSENESLWLKAGDKIISMAAHLNKKYCNPFFASALLSSAF